jgi:heme o synthase
MRLSDRGKTRPRRFREADPLKPVSKDGTDDCGNLQRLQWEGRGKAEIHAGRVSLENSGLRVIPGLLADAAVLVKLRLNALAVFPALSAFIISGGSTRPATIACLLLGMLCAGFGASALNQWVERHLDARMDRTRNRPVAAGRLSPFRALLTGVLLSILGTGVILLFFTKPAALLTIVTILIYWGVYTPLKQRTSWCTEVGAVSGALPTLIGAAAAEGALGLPAWNLFAIVFLWQMPHFYPTAWRYRADYGRAGFRILGATEESGDRAGNKAVLYATALLPVSLLPAVWMGAGPAYLAAASTLGAGYILFAGAFRCARDRRRAAANLFRYSLLYLFLLFLAVLGVYFEATP